MAPGITGISSLARLEDIKKDIRCLLISMGSRDVTLFKLNRLYKDIADDDIPFKDFNFTSLKEFLSSMPDVVRLEYNKANEICAYHIDTQKSKHISNLVTKERKKSQSDKSRSKSIHRDNPIDPWLLYEVLQDLIDISEYKNTKSRINKVDVLSEITKRIGTYTFYTLQDLNSQLNELTHILIHDDGYIYLKKKLAENDNSKKTIQITATANDFGCEKVMKETKLSDFIRDTTKNRLKMLIEKHSEGIWCSDLPKIYQREYGYDLEYSDLGFNSIIEFVGALPHIFQIVKPLNATRLMVLDARASKYNLQNVQISNSLPLQRIENVSNIEPIPTRLSTTVSKTLIPEYVMSFDESVDQIIVTSLIEGPKQCIDVIVSEVKNPSFFWITLFKNRRRIASLMNQLQEFYTQQNLDKYRIPKIVLQIGLHIACIFADMWHRGIIKKINEDKLSILFYDYGTSYTYTTDKVYFLDKRFAAVPAQAIPCSLSNIRPIGEYKWSIEVSQKFQSKVLDKPFIAFISNIDKRNNSMIINLIDTSNHVNVHMINDWMVKNKLAEWGEIILKKNNFTFTHYKNCQEMNTSSPASTESNNSSSTTYVTFSKKLEVIKNYQKIHSSSLSTSPNASNSIDSNNKEDDDSENILKVHNESVDDQVSDSCSSKLDKTDKTDELDHSNENIIHQKCNSIEDFTNSLCSSNFISDSLDDSSHLENNLNQIMFKCSDPLPIKPILDIKCHQPTRRNLTIGKLPDKHLPDTFKELQKLITSTKL